MALLFFNKSPNSCSLPPKASFPFDEKEHGYKFFSPLKNRQPPFKSSETKDKDALSWVVVPSTRSPSPFSSPSSFSCDDDDDDENDNMINVSSESDNVNDDNDNDDNNNLEQVNYAPAGPNMTDMEDHVPYDGDYGVSRNSIYSYHSYDPSYLPDNNMNNSGNEADNHDDDDDDDDDDDEIDRYLSYTAESACVRSRHVHLYQPSTRNTATYGRMSRKANRSHSKIRDIRIALTSIGGRSAQHAPLKSSKHLNSKTTNTANAITGEIKATNHKAPTIPHIYNPWDTHNQYENDDDDDDDGAEYIDTSSCTYKESLLEKSAIELAHRRGVSIRWARVLLTRAAKKTRIKQIQSVGIRAYKKSLGIYASSSSSSSSSSQSIPVESHRTHFNSFDSFARHFYMTHKASLSKCLSPTTGNRVAGFRLSTIYQNSFVTHRFLRMMSSLNQYPALTFHGTHIQNMQSICEKGLIVPNENESSNGGVRVVNGSSYGVGIYSSRTAEYSLSYARQTSTMFVCAVLDRDASVAQTHKLPSVVNYPRYCGEYECDGIRASRNIVVAFDAARILPLFLMDFDNCSVLGSTTCRSNGNPIDERVIYAILKMRRAVTAKQIIATNSQLKLSSS